MSLKRHITACVLMLLAASVLGGCGITDQSEGAAKLLITNITDSSGSNSLEFYSNEARKDTNNNGLPDPDETLVAPMESDRIIVTVTNEPRLGVDNPVDLVVYRIMFTYLDAHLNRRTFAPQNIQNVNVTLKAKESKAIEVVGIPREMKPVQGGLSDIFLFGSEAQIADVQTWKVYVDVYALDPINDDDIHSQGIVTVKFVNPMPILGVP